jgi:hypothetical protein
MILKICVMAPIKRYPQVAVPSKSVLVRAELTDFQFTDNLNLSTPADLCYYWRSMIDFAHTTIQNLVVFSIDLDPSMLLVYRKYNDILISVSTRAGCFSY